jgi:hypothetical protein
MTAELPPHIFGERITASDDHIVLDISVWFICQMGDIDMAGFFEHPIRTMYYLNDARLVIGDPK